MEDKEIILSQWQTCVEMANSISQRRDSMNNIFVTINLAIVTSLTLLTSANYIFIPLIGIVYCFVWVKSIENYKRLNKAKFDVILELEKELPKSPMKDEWDKLSCDKKYSECTKMESLLPIAFGAVYFIAIGIYIIGKVCIKK